MRSPVGWEVWVGMEQKMKIVGIELRDQAQREIEIINLLTEIRDLMQSLLKPAAAPAKKKAVRSDVSS